MCVSYCVQGASSPDSSMVYVDMRALRNDRVTLVEKGSPLSLPVMESGKLLPGVKVVIANPETRGLCADSHLGEVSDPYSRSSLLVCCDSRRSQHVWYYHILPVAM